MKIPYGYYVGVLAGIAIWIFVIEPLQKRKSKHPIDSKAQQDPDSSKSKNA